MLGECHLLLAMTWRLDVGLEWSCSLQPYLERHKADSSLAHVNVPTSTQQLFWQGD